MTFLSTVAPPPPLQFDFAFIRKCALYFGAAGVAVAPFVREPLAVAGGGMMPYLLLTIIDTPRMPSIAVFFLLYQWVEVVTRVFIGMVDNEGIGEGLYGANVTRAYWYCFASLLTFAGALRLALGNLPEVPRDQMIAHLSWRPSKLFWAYILIAVVSVPLFYASLISPGLAQPVATLASLKNVALLMLFIMTLSSGRGLPWAFAALAIEAGTGFVGFFSYFKEVFFVFGLAALSARLPLRPVSLLISLFGAAFLVVLLLFWTAIKPEYREMASGGSNIQVVTAPLEERVGFLVQRAFSPGEISWGQAAEALLRRIQAVDYFGATIGTVETSPESGGAFAQWGGVFDHIFRPRILFPDKEALNDIELYERFVRVEVSEEQRSTTSIGVGYLAENFVDFGFPLMLVPVLGLGLFFGVAVRYFLTRPVPWIAQEAFAFGCLYAASSGVGSALAKLVGGFILEFLVLALVLKFAFPSYRKWVS